MDTVVIAAGAIFTAGLLVYGLQRGAEIGARKPTKTPIHVGFDHDHIDENGDDLPVVNPYVIRRRNGVRYYSDPRVNFGEPTEIYSRLPMRLFLDYADTYDNDVERMAQAFVVEGIWAEESMAHDALMYAGRTPARIEAEVGSGLIARSA